MARLREASRAQRGRIMTEDGDGDVWVAGTCLAVSQTCPRQIHRLLSHLYDRWRLAFASEMLKCDKGDQVQTLGIVVSHRLLQDLNKGLSLAVSTHAAPVDRFDHIWVSRRQTQGSDAASSISEDVGRSNTESLLMMLQRTFLRDLWSDMLTMTAATSSAANDHENGSSMGPDFDKP
jgi:hypothetical protein